jgi:hypothetical protein
MPLVSGWRFSSVECFAHSIPAYRICLDLAARLTDDLLAKDHGRPMPSRCGQGTRKARTHDVLVTEQTLDNWDAEKKKSLVTRMLAMWPDVRSMTGSFGLDSNSQRLNQMTFNKGLTLCSLLYRYLTALNYNCVSLCIDWLIIYCFTLCFRKFHLYRDVTITGRSHCKMMSSCVISSGELTKQTWDGQIYFVTIIISSVFVTILYGKLFYYLLKK